MKRLLRPGVYCVTTSAYAATRKMLDVRDGSTLQYEKKTLEPRRAPLLLTTKAAIVAIHAVYGPIFWPLLLYRDVNVIEIGVRGLDRDLYGLSKKKHSALEYIFS